MKLSKVDYKNFCVVVVLIMTTIGALNAQEEKDQGERKLGYFEKSEQIGYVLLKTDTTEDGSVQLSMESHYTINPTVELNVDEGSSLVAHNDSIVEISSFAKINDRSRFNISQTWKDELNKYSRTVNSRTKELALPILKSTYLSLFFAPPKEGENSIYSEVFDKSFNVKRNSSTKFTITDHLDRTKEFEYTNDGKFKSAEITNSTGVYTIKEIK